jgi:ligand-binding SRPBCC domain-containing protein
MKTYSLTTELLIPRPIDEVFAFFSDAHNLEQITPPLLKFHILSPRGIDMHEGTRLDYKLKLHGWPIRWQTLISGWDPPYFFEDRQLRGPYRQWIHKHAFQETPEGVLCSDRVDYGVPGGGFMHWLMVKRDVRSVFEFRQTKLNELLADGKATLTKPVTIQEGLLDSDIEPAAISRKRADAVAV